ncbi:MAG TPA: hypothetical protein VKZ63_16550 [Kofleriaceae bacterium]|nr:hypothetical protein [Kofleriaceae bacterium]
MSWEQEDVHAIRIARSARVSVPDREVLAAVRRARQLGLRVLLFPILTVRRTRPGQWRGALRPREVGAWWLSYERFVLHHAALAARGGAEALLVGSELGFSEGWRDRWYHLLSRVERVYPGDLVYSANWDHYRHVSFLARLDHLGVSAYFPLTGEADASEAELARAWRRHRAELARFARERGISLWLTEVGYQSRDGAAVRPWDHTAPGAVDLEEQRRALAALRGAWEAAPAGEPAIGLFIWNWWGDGGPRDRDYTPRGKPAAALLRAWFRGGATTSPPPAGSSR